MKKYFKEKREEWKKKESDSEQLNVYAFIWQNLRNNELDKTAVISTSFPRGLDEALKENNPARIAHEFAQCDPIIDFATLDILVLLIELLLQRSILEALISGTIFRKIRMNLNKKSF